MADIAWIGSGVKRGANDQTAVLNRTGVLPGSAGNICIGVISIKSGTITTPPANWTLLASRSYGTAEQLYVYWHVHLGASEPTTASFPITGGAAVRWSSINHEFGNVDTTTIKDVENSQANASSTTVTAPGVDPVYTNDMLLLIDAASASVSLTQSTAQGFTLPTNGDGQNTSISVGLQYKLLTTGTATGNHMATISAAAVNAGMLVALLNTSPAADGTPGALTVAAAEAAAAGLSVGLTGAGLLIGTATAAGAQGESVALHGPLGGGGTLPVAAAGAVAAGGAVTLIAASKLIVASATAPAQGQAVVLGGQAVLAVAPATADADTIGRVLVVGDAAVDGVVSAWVAESVDGVLVVGRWATTVPGGDAVTLTGQARLVGTAATASAAAGTVGLNGGTSVAGTLTLAAATASSAGGAVALGGAALLAAGTAAAAAASGIVALRAAATLTVVGASAPAAGGTVALYGGTSIPGTLTVAPAPAAASGNAVALAGSARLAVALALADAAAALALFSAGARLILDPAPAAATAHGDLSGVTLISGGRVLVGPAVVAAITGPVPASTLVGPAG